jgi:hypothetical protein
MHLQCEKLVHHRFLVLGSTYMVIIIMPVFLHTCETIRWSQVELNLLLRHDWLTFSK